MSYIHYQVFLSFRINPLDTEENDGTQSIIYNNRSQYAV